MPEKIANPVEPKCFHTMTFFTPQGQAENGCDDCEVRSACFSCDKIKNVYEEQVERMKELLFKGE